MTYMEQGSDEWLRARLGKVTASRVFDLIPGKSGRYLKSRSTYMDEKLAEKLSGEPLPHFMTKAMEWGVEWEPVARGAFEALMNLEVKEVGFIPHPTIPEFGSSPDGLIGDDWGLEIKCPNTTTHIRFLLTKEIEPRYQYQMMANMMCTGRKNWYFVSYDPRLTQEFKFAVKEFKFDEAMALKIEEEVKIFNNEMNEMIRRLYESVE